MHIGGRWSDNRSGMSLIEVMIAMGVASALMLGMLSIAELSQRQVKTVSLQAEWQRQVAAFRLAMSHHQRCSSMFTDPALTGDSYYGGSGSSSTITFQPTVTESTPILVQSLGYRIGTTRHVLFERNRTFQEIRPTEIRLYDSGTPAVAKEVSLEGDTQTYRVLEYVAVLEIHADRDYGMVRAFGSQHLPPEVIEFKLHTLDPANSVWPAGGEAHQVIGCQGGVDEVLCTSMGGVYDEAAASATPPGPLCRLPSLGLLGARPDTGDDFSEPGLPAGQRLRFSRYHANHGLGEESDFSIGMERWGSSVGDENMWFNAGTNTPGTVSQVHVAYGSSSITARPAFRFYRTSSSGSTDAREVMAITNQGDLYVGGSNKFPRVVFDGATQGESTTNPSVYIASHRTACGSTSSSCLGYSISPGGEGSHRDRYTDEGNRNGLDLHTNQRSRLRLSHSGHVKIGPNDHGSGSPLSGSLLVFGYGSPADEQSYIRNDADKNLTIKSGYALNLNAFREIIINATRDLRLYGQNTSIDSTSELRVNSGRNIRLFVPSNRNVSVEVGGVSRLVVNNAGTVLSGFLNVGNTSATSGNVPHSCTTRLTSRTVSANTWADSIACFSNEIAIQGGPICPGSGYIRGLHASTVGLNSIAYVCSTGGTATVRAVCCRYTN